MTRSEIEKTIEGRIIRGEYEIKSSLPSERSFAEEFGVSRSLMHEVLLSLSGKHFIESRPRVGYTVTDWVREANIDIFGALLDATMDDTTYDIARSFGEFRVFNEGKCAALAAQKRSEEDLARMKACMDRLENAESREAFAHEVALFHHLVFNASGNRLYAVLYGTFMPLIEKWSWTMFPDWQKFDLSSLDLVLRCIERKDAITAEVTMTAYMTESIVRVAGVVRKPEKLTM